MVNEETAPEGAHEATAALRVAVGSANPVKLRAAKDAVSAVWPGASVEGIAVTSSVAAQPWSDEETLEGAAARARAAREALGAEVGVGIESGVARSAGGLFTFTWVLVENIAGRQGRGCSARLELPPAVAAHLERGEELEEALRRVYGVEEAGRGGGALGLLTGGRVSRFDATVQAILLALAPFAGSSTPR